MRKPLLLKLTVDLINYKEGQLIAVKKALDGLPLDPFWRNRVADGCVKVITEKKIVKETKDEIKKEVKVKKHLKKEVETDDDI